MKTLLLLHGGPGMSSDYFQPLVESHQINAHLVTYTQKRKAEFIEELVDELCEKIEAIESNEIYIYGHSFGGILALLASKNYSNRVRGLIIDPPILDDRFKYFMCLNKLGAQPIDYKDLTKSLEKSYFSKGDKYKVLDKIDYDQVTKDNIGLNNLNAYNLFDLVQGFKGRTLFIHGSEDQIITKSYIDKLPLQIATIDKASHFTFLDNLNAFCVKVNNFLNV